MLRVILRLCKIISSQTSDKIAVYETVHYEHSWSLSHSQLAQIHDIILVVSNKFFTSTLTNTASSTLHTLCANSFINYSEHLSEIHLKVISMLFSNWQRKPFHVHRQCEKIRIEFNLKFLRTPKYVSLSNLSFIRSQSPPGRKVCGGCKLRTINWKMKNVNYLTMQWQLFPLHPTVTRRHELSGQIISQGSSVHGWPIKTGESLQSLPQAVS